MKIILSVTALLLLLACGTTKKEPAQLVNPFIGTDYVGNTYPGASAPFGMVQLSPDNGLSGWDRIAGYFYPDSTIAGFSHTHLSGTGAGDLYDISFLPVTLPWREEVGELGVYSAFSHEKESAEAGYYAVHLEDYGIDVELTATPRCGIQRYRFPQSKAAVLLDLKKAMNWDFTDDSHIELLDSCTIRGYRFSKGWASDQRVFFVSRFSRPFVRHEITHSDIAPNHGFTTTGKGAKAIFYYDTQEGDELVVTTALSAVDYEGAMANLVSEAPHNDFDTYRKQVQKEWNGELGKIEVTMARPDDEVTFYTALYHSMLAPTLYSDVDGRYRGPDKQIHTAEEWDNYSTFSLWDTYRAQHPLLLLTQDKRSDDMMLSLLRFGQQQGRLPVWNFAGCETDMMIGYHSIVVLAEALLKGMQLPTDEILALAHQTANIDEYRNIGDYKRYGYIPYSNAEESVSKTLEYAYDDYAISRIVSLVDSSSHRSAYVQRSTNWMNLWDASSGFFRPRDAKGRWLEPFDPKEYSKHFTESNAWQYLFNNIDSDPVGGAMFPNRESLERKLDEMFASSSDGIELPIFSTGMIGQYAHGNEPGHHVPYLYNYTEHPEKGEKILHRIMREFYTNTPGGLCGNEDCGQMSAWYVFSALGFYPVGPLTGYYEIGTPLVESARITLSSGNVLSIKVKRATPESIHVQRATLNGVTIQHRRFSHEELVKGGELLFELH